MKYKNILFVDDDADDLLLFSEALNDIEAQISFETASDGITALKKLTTSASVPELIFLDLNMPMMHGFECLKKIKADKKLQGTPVIIFTTSSSPLDINMAKHLGAAAYFCKPMHFNHLCDHLKMILMGELELNSGFKIINSK